MAQAIHNLDLLRNHVRGAVIVWRRARNRVHNASNIAWARDTWHALRPFAPGGVYVNELGEDDGNRVREAYAGNYDRLAAIKAKYDPDNLFRLNANIKPVAAAAVT